MRRTARSARSPVATRPRPEPRRAAVLVRFSGQELHSPVVAPPEGEPVCCRPFRNRGLVLQCSLAVACLSRIEMLNRNLNRPMAPSRAVAQPGAPAASRAGAFPRGAVAVAILFMGELRRSWVLFRRYPLQAISGIGMTLFLFLGLVFGARYMAGPMARFGDRLGSLVVGYILWNVLIFAMGEIAMGLQGEAQIGTLEQLFLSPRSMVTVFL